MTNGLSSREAKMLTWALYAVLFILSSATTWTAFEIYSLPDKFVRLERYQKDNGRLEATMEKIDCKLDRLIERKVGN